MDDRSLKALDFYDLLEILKEFSVSPLGRKHCEALRPSRDPAVIQARLAEVLELKEILETVGDLPIRGLKDISGILGRLEVEGSIFGIEEILDIYRQMELCKGLRRFFQKLEAVKAAHLQEKISRLSLLKALEKEILQAVNTKGEILDRASPALSDVRHRMRKVRENVKGVLEQLLHQEELQPIFQEPLITLRNGRYVILIKSECKHRLEGIIHDQSQSRMTFFFEPLQVVALNNEINILMGEEKEEEYRILADLSDKIREERQNLWGDFKILGEFDLIYAMAKLTLLLKGVQPILNEDGKINMKEARNPLLALQKDSRVVPIHLRIRDRIKGLILSGANAGGKTVALKTLGILTLMAQSGLPIPVAEGSEVGIYDNILAVIGDEQSIGENLSTFSSHLLHVDQILRKAGPRCLILLDELGVGTHASEGCALAMSFLDQFRESGATFVVTTHFDRLKGYGYLHSDVENAAVEFDEETLEPKYTLSYGSSGLSNALLVAEKLGISERVLEMASHYLDGGEQEVTRTLEILERLKADVEKERQKLLKMEDEVGVKRQRLTELLDGIKRRRQEILSQADEKARKAVQKVEEELKEWVRQRKMIDSTLQKEKSLPKLVPLNAYHKEIQAIKEKSFPSIKKKGLSTPLGGLKLGEHVKIVTLGSQGIVVGVEESLKQVEVITDKAKVKTSFSDIVKVTDEKVVDSILREDRGIEILKNQPLPQKNGQESPSQLNVIGLTVEDALPKVDKFIDQALLHGLEKIHIVHGVGTGRLRNAIGKYLQGHQGVKGFAPGEGMRGGHGITVVELG